MNQELEEVFPFKVHLFYDSFIAINLAINVFKIHIYYCRQKNIFANPFILKKLHCMKRSCGPATRYGGA
jgi:hypothetical protein